MWLDKIKWMKQQSGMTTKEITQKSGIPEPTLEKLFSGATKDPKLETMRQLVHSLGYSLDDLDDHSSVASPHGSGMIKCTVSEEEYCIVSAYRMASEADRGIIDNIVSRYVSTPPAKLYIAARDGSRMEAEADSGVTPPAGSDEIPT